MAKAKAGQSFDGDKGLPPAWVENWSKDNQSVDAQCVTQQSAASGRHKAHLTNG
jgi:hypothetical protein